MERRTTMRNGTVRLGGVAVGEENRTAQLAGEGAMLQGGEPLFREMP